MGINGKTVQTGMRFSLPREWQAWVGREGVSSLRWKL